MSTLYVVATPIGNLGDMSPRAVETLKKVGLIAAEDTRVTMKLTAHFDIHTPLVSCHQHNERDKSQSIVERMLSEDMDVALVTDAGTPAISDPGTFLVRRCAEAGIPVMAVAGPSAMAAAMSVSGFDCTEFTFYGFLPRQKNELREKLKDMARCSACAIVHESPYRVRELTETIAETLPEARVSASCDLTKLHEKTSRGTAREVADALAQNEKAEKGDTVAWSGGAKPMNLIKVDDDTWVSIENGSMFTNKDVQTRIENGHESDFTESKYSGLSQNEKLNSAFSSGKDVDDVQASASQNIGGLPVGSIYTDDKGHAYIKLEDGNWSYKEADGDWRITNSSYAEFRIANSYAESKGWEPKNIARVALEKSSIENRPIKKRETSMTENDIIRFVAGGDETVGSCASAALAYVGDKAGFEVRDFRDGDSRKFFSLVMNNKEVLKIGKGYREEADFNEKDAAVRLLNSMEEGKQYVLGTGRHMSVVKKENGDFMYLELQSSGHDGTTNGWHSMKKRYGTVKKALTGRFGCVSRGKFAQFGVKQTARMVDIDALGKSTEFQKILGYLNTAEGKEKKGVSGHIA